MDNPRKRTTIATEVVGDGLGVFDQQQQQAYVLNATSALVWQHCDGQTTPEQLMELVRQKFNVPRPQAEELTWLALDELSKANLLMAEVARPRPLSSAFTRRQMLTAFAMAGVAFTLVPMVAPVTVRAGGHTLIPLLTCVVDNGDGTFTAFFGYTNVSSAVITVPIGPKNQFVHGAEDDLGQPTTFQPGTHDSVFSVVFDADEELKWMLKADGDKRHQVEADADSELCSTTTGFPATTGF